MTKFGPIYFSISRVNVLTGHFYCFVLLTQYKCFRQIPKKNELSGKIVYLDATDLRQNAVYSLSLKTGIIHLVA